jgi:LmbE family N-acetylglucosaminyl deacetylase
VLQGFYRLGRSLAYRLAADRTDACADTSALVLAPHPDDETLGCGGVIARKVAAGTPVTVVVLTDGRDCPRDPAWTDEYLVALRQREATEATGRLGLAPESLRCMGFVDGTLAGHEDQLVKTIDALVAELRPDEVYVTGAWEPHPDHAALGRAARRAVRGARLLEYPVWLWEGTPLTPGVRAGTVLAGMAGLLVPGRAVTVRTGGHLAAKRAAITAYRSQLDVPASLPPGLLRQADGDVEVFGVPPARLAPG